jgi:uncharacterized membrane protein YdjX (TVP38/TMEM64 family)|tara:strand:+ start:409 stop:570 length:162 start_codon:yes stop_codon:yes gene_type:complete
MRNRSKEEIAIAWIIIMMFLVPLVIIYPVTIIAVILGYALWVVWDNHHETRKQ